jgi:hypothetical protein
MLVVLAFCAVIAVVIVVVIASAIALDEALRKEG